MLDMKTLLVVTILLTLLSPVIFYMVHRVGLWVGGTLQWAIASAVTCLAMVMLLLRGAIPDFISIVLANSLAVLAYGLSWCGVSLFVDRPPRYKAVVALSLLQALPMFWFSQIHPSLPARVVFSSAFIAGFCLVTAWDLFRGALALKRLMRIFCGVVFGLNAAYMMVRIVLALTYPMEEPYFKSGFINQALYLWSSVFIVLLLTSMVLMVSEKMQAEIKTLSGILPICAKCKKVRDDSGYWQQVESYISAHSDAEFSHGLCPECLTASLEEIRRMSASQGGPDSADRG